MAERCQTTEMRHREIRVFISSTFHDMQAERDYLVKFVFPELRRLCESRGVTWGEVDLRWGVTDEQKAEGKVLPICLEEIRRCRPYFIGLLGERYGWIPAPDAIPAALYDQVPWLHDHVHGKRSVTELEIIHGVLREETMHGYAYFYFRDPRYLEKLPADTRADFATESAEHAAKLQSLKQKIRAARNEQVCHLGENYRDLKELGDWIRKDFTRLINELFPERSQPDPLDREAMDHAAFAQSRARVYIGRQEYFDRLDAYVSGNNEGQGLVVLGEPGSGKSALLANWAARHQKAHPEDLLLQHYIGATPYSTDWAAMVRRIMGEFKRRIGIHLDIPDETHELKAAFANGLHMAAVSRPTVLVLDALNQLEDRDQALDLFWLPPVFPANLRLIISTLPGRPLASLAKRGWPSLTIQPLGQVERFELIGRYLAQYSKTLDAAQASRIAGLDQSDNPLYLSTLLEELRLFGQYEHLNDKIEEYLEATTVTDLYEKVLVRYEQDYEDDRPGLVRDAMSLLWAARRGLSETELLDILGNDCERLPRAHWSPLFIAAEQLLVSRSGLIGFSHAYLRDAVVNRYLRTESAKQATHIRLADYFDARELNPRKIDELPWHLAEAVALRRLHDLLAQVEFFANVWAVSEFDAKMFWARLDHVLHGSPLDAYRLVLARPSRYPTAQVSAVAGLLEHTGQLEEALSLRNYLVDHYQKTGNQDSLYVALTTLAQSLRTIGNAEASTRVIDQAIAAAPKLPGGIPFPYAIQAMGVVFADRGDKGKAADLFRAVIEICRRVPGEFAAKKKLLAGSLQNLAEVLDSRHSTDEALSVLRQAENIWRELGVWNNVASCLQEQAELLRSQEYFAEAVSCLDKAENICRSYGDMCALYDVMTLRAEIATMEGDMASAMTLHKEVERGCYALGWKRGLLNSLRGQSFTLMHARSFHGAIFALGKLTRVCRSLGRLADAARFQCAKGLLLGNVLGCPREAMDVLREAQELAGQAGLSNLQEELKSHLVEFDSYLAQEGQ